MSSESEEGEFHLIYYYYPHKSHYGLLYFLANVIINQSEPEPLHVVSTFTDMPEGASISDNEDNDQNDNNDPHKALDIDLDM